MISLLHVQHYFPTSVGDLDAIYQVARYHSKCILSYLPMEMQRNKLSSNNLATNGSSFVTQKNRHHAVAGESTQLNSLKVGLG